MKKTIFPLLMLISLFQAQLAAQTSAGISLLLGQPRLGKGISAQHQSSLENKLLSLFAAGDGSIGAKYSAFAVMPVLEILEQGKIEGMKNKPIVKLNLTMKLQNVYSGEVLEVREYMFTGSGNTADEAISKAIGGLRKNQPKLGKALKEFQTLILGFYEKNCASVMATANDFASRQQYRDAFAMLQSVPQGTSCYGQVEDAKKGYYQQVQSAGCAANIASANAAKAANDFSKALNILGSVDAESPCFGEAKALVASLETTVDEELKTRYEWLFKFHAAGTEAEAARWNAMNSLFLGWLRESGKVNITN